MTLTKLLGIIVFFHTILAVLCLDQNEKEDEPGQIRDARNVPGNVGQKYEQNPNGNPPPTSLSYGKGTNSNYHQYKSFKHQESYSETNKPHSLKSSSHNRVVLTGEGLRNDKFYTIPSSEVKNTFMTNFHEGYKPSASKIPVSYNANGESNFKSKNTHSENSNQHYQSSQDQAGKDDESFLLPYVKVQNSKVYNDRRSEYPVPSMRKSTASPSNSERFETIPENISFEGGSSPEDLNLGSDSGQQEILEVFPSKYSDRTNLYMPLEGAEKLSASQKLKVNGDNTYQTSTQSKPTKEKQAYFETPIADDDESEFTGTLRTNGTVDEKSPLYLSTYYGKPINHEAVHLEQIPQLLALPSESWPPEDKPGPAAIANDEHNLHDLPLTPIDGSDIGSIYKIKKTKFDSKIFTETQPLGSVKILQYEQTGSLFPTKPELGDLLPKFMLYKNKLKVLISRMVPNCPTVNSNGLLKTWAIMFKNAFPNYDEMTKLSIKYAEDLKSLLTSCINETAHNKFNDSNNDGARIEKESIETESGKVVKRQISKEEFIESITSDVINPIVDYFAKMPQMVQGIYTDESDRRN